MLLEETDRATFKQWIVPKLETISDADADVLADYVIALIIADESELAVKQNCLDSLSDFLQDPKPFVDEVLNAVKNKSFLPVFKAKAKPANYLPTPAPIASTPVFSPQATSTPASARIVPSAVALSVQTPISSPALSADAAPFNPPTGPAAALKLQPHLPDRPTGPPPPLNTQARIPGVGNYIQNGRGSLKRKLNDREWARQRSGQDSHCNRDSVGDKPPRKFVRKSDRDIQNGRDVQNLVQSAKPGHTAIMNPMTSIPNLSALPLPPAGLPQFNPADPMSFLTMAAALGMGFPGMPPVPPMPFPRSPFTIGLPGSNGQTHLPTLKERCQDYDTKGFCVLGSVCPYDHGEYAILPESIDGTSKNIFTANSTKIHCKNGFPITLAIAAHNFVLEYDPDNASLAFETGKTINGQPMLNRVHSRNGMRSMVVTSDGSHAPFSHVGPTADRTDLTVVVEQIPEECFSEDDVRNFFSQFGHIANVDMQVYKHRAIVTYEDHVAARRAYDSPKVIFGNRFVKVYWLKPDVLSTVPANGKKLNITNYNSSGLKQPDAYQQDEGMLTVEEIEKRQGIAQIAWEQRQEKLQEMEIKLDNLQERIKAKEHEILELRKRVAAKDGVEFVDETKDTALIEQLQALQAEARNLGLNAKADSFSSRGGYRGRGSFLPRRRGRGRGVPYLAGARTSVKRLDFRPRGLAVAGIETGSLKDEALRQHLTKRYELDSITAHPNEEHTLLVTFKERYMAEMFLDDSLNIPEVGKLELSWVPNDPKSKPASDKPLGTDGDIDKDEVIESTETTHDGDDDIEFIINEGDDVSGNHANDYDVADDVDEWL